MLKFGYKLYAKIVNILAAPLCLAYVFRRDVGREYSVGAIEKLKFLVKFRLNASRIVCASNWLEHVCLATEILSIPKAVPGDIIECGCFKGGSTANLSLICGRVGRKLVVCDSFEGLPPCEDRDKVHYNFFRRRKRVYEQGQFAGRLDEVQENIQKFGNIQACEFVKGYFEQTLPKLRQTSFAMAFVDVDLHKSLEDCLVSVWPKLVEGAKLFSHEAQDVPYVALFFDKEWWQLNLKSNSPGFVGAGTGLPLAIASGSGLGYAVKVEQTVDTGGWRTVNFTKTNE